MAGLPGMRALLTLNRSLTLQRCTALIPAQSTFTCSHRLCSSAVVQENDSLLENLNLMGVDVMIARQRHPAVFRKASTHEQALSEFLHDKGASRKVIAGIISRYPRAITRPVDLIAQRWELWRNFCKTDKEIINILNRSPEPFFRSGDNGTLEGNITFLTSLGFSSEHLHQLIATAPRALSNSLELNKQTVKFLEEICAELGGENPPQIAKNIIFSNLFILIRSTKRIKTNIDILKASVQFSNAELLDFFQGQGADVLSLSSEYLKKSSAILHEKLVAAGCRKDDIKELIISSSFILHMGPNTLCSKLDCLLNGGIPMKQILQKPRVLAYSMQNIAGRIEELKKVEYDYNKNGISILDSSKKRFDAKIKRLVVDFSNSNNP